MNEIITSIELEKEHSTSWGSIVGTPGNRRRMRVILGIAFFSQWSGNGLVSARRTRSFESDTSLTHAAPRPPLLLVQVSYYLTDVLKAIGITSETIQTLYNGILALFNFAIAVVAAFMVDKIGRRTLFLTVSTSYLYMAPGRAGAGRGGGRYYPFATSSPLPRVPRRLPSPYPVNVDRHVLTSSSDIAVDVRNDWGLAHLDHLRGRLRQERRPGSWKG